MRNMLIGLGLAAALVSFIPTSLAMTEAEVAQASAVVEGLFKGTIELSTMPQDQNRWDKQYQLFARHLYLAHSKNGPDVFGSDWEKASQEDKDFFNRVVVLYISEAHLVRGIAKSMDDLKGDLYRYADYLGLDKKVVEGWISDPKSIPIRAEKLEPFGRDTDNTVRFRVVALPDLVDRVRKGEVRGIGDDELKEIVFYVKIMKNPKAQDDYRIAEIYQPESNILIHNPALSHQFTHLVFSFTNPGGQFRSVLKNNRDLRTPEPGLTKVRQFSNWLWSEYQRRFTKD
ncbi:MAG: hypothetical protein KDD43_03655 [Bdellovibrionales bacterium]|nr:hypothetical protein [Bdellovibrionales bacterium]